MIRFFDIVLSFIFLVITSPLFILIGIVIKYNSRGPVFYRQNRVGRKGIDFTLLKFRTMFIGSDKNLHLTIGDNDSRITRIGIFLRKYKIDELPQFINVLIGDMSIVGPRPEVRKFVDLYTDEQKNILTVRPGLTDFASIVFKNENNMLLKYEDPVAGYIDFILPQKIRLNMIFIRKQNIFQYFKIIFLTVVAVVKPNPVTNIEF